MNSFPVTTLKENTFFTQELVLDKQFILLNPTCPFNNALKKALLEWDFKVVYSDGSIGSGAVASPTPQDFEQVSIEQVDPNANDPKKPEMGDNVKKALEEAHQDLANNEKSRMSVVQTVYNEYMNYITAVYTHYATHKVLDYQELSNTVKDLCIFIKDNRRYVLRITPTLEAANKNFIVSHSMRSTVTAIVIGLQLRMPLTKLIELGVTCILHEIGQIRLPPQLYMTGKRLSAPERAKLATHPIIGFNIVKENDFPLAVQLGVLEHHERENGTGYPRKLTGNKISLYAKIIAVACSFEAISGSREYREERSTFEALIEMLRNTNRQYEETILKSLLYSISLYPIGVYVYLSNGRIAQVVDVSVGNPKTPFVQIIGETDAAGNPKIVQIDALRLKIVRVLNKAEVEDMLKAIKK